MQTESSWAGSTAPAAGGASNVDEPPLEDPYYALARVRAIAARGPRSQSPLAITSVLTLLLGPVGALASIVFGGLARRDILREGRREGLGVANAGIVLGVVMTAGWAAAIGALWVKHLAPPAPIAASSADETDPVDAEPSLPDPPRAPPPNHAPLPHAGGAAARPVPPVAPKKTTTTHIGGVIVVDVGAGTSALGDELSKQRADAAKSSETLLMMTTAGKCDPCRGVDRSLADPALQTALGHARLVRVDVDVFHEELKALQVPTEAIPGFFLLAPDLTPRDGLNGGEWDDDIPQNIAPVLGPFLRGKYATRRQPWRSRTGSSIRL